MSGGGTHWVQRWGHVGVGTPPVFRGGLVSAFRSPHKACRGADDGGHNCPHRLSSETSVGAPHVNCKPPPPNTQHIPVPHMNAHVCVHECAHIRRLSQYQSQGDASMEYCAAPRRNLPRGSIKTRGHGPAAPALVPPWWLCVSQMYSGGYGCEPCVDAIADGPCVRAQTPTDPVRIRNTPASCG